MKDLILEDEKQKDEEVDSTHLNDSFGGPKTIRSSNSQMNIKLKDDKNLKEFPSINDSIDHEANSKINQSDSSRTMNSIIKNDSITRDLRLKYVLNILDLNQFYHLFDSSNLTFNDILILSKEDLIEMNIQLAARNRILKFSEAYKLHGKSFTLKEIKEFFLKNKNFCFNLGNSEEITKEENTHLSMTSPTNMVKLNTTCKGEEDKVNFYETLPTADFNHENNQNTNINNYRKSTQNQKSSQNLKLMEFYHNNIANDPSISNANYNFYDESTTLADYISQNFSSNMHKKRNSKKLSIAEKLNSPEIHVVASDEDNRKNFITKTKENNFFNSKSNFERSDSEEKSIQTYNFNFNDMTIPHRKSQNQFFSEKSFNLSNLCNIRYKNDEMFNKIQNEEGIESSQINQGNENDRKANLNEELEEDQKKKSSNFEISEKNKISPSMINSKKLDDYCDKKKKTNNAALYKNYQNLSDEIGKYIKSFKELKEKSENRNNRFKCLISKSIKSKTNFNSSSIEKPHRECNTVIFKNNTSKRNLTENLEVPINDEYLEDEEERDLNKEIIKISNKIPTREISSNKIKRINSMSDLDVIRDDNYEDHENINFLKKSCNKTPSERNLLMNELNSLFSILERKKSLHNVLDKCNSDILENKKVRKFSLYFY